MEGRKKTRGFGLRDATALVMGVAIASVHVRLAVDGSRVDSWPWAVALFGLVAATASGPFVYLARRLAGPQTVGRPRAGDRLWAVCGVPWVAAATAKALASAPSVGPGRVDPVYVGSLGLGLFLVTLVAVPLVAALVLWGEPAVDHAGGSWSHAVGVLLAATWPIQCGVGLVLMG